MRSNPKNGLIAQLLNPLKTAEKAIEEYEADEAAAMKKPCSSTALDHFGELPHVRPHY